MFNYNEKTKVDMRFKMLDLFKTIKADKTIKKDAENISSVTLTNVLSASKTGMDSTEFVQEIYVIEIVLNKKIIPSIFIESLNKSINFQSLFVIKYGDQSKYICSIKEIKDEKAKILKTFQTEFINCDFMDLPLAINLEKVYKYIVENISGIIFRDAESFAGYIDRTSEIKRQKLELDRLCKLRDSEKQPNIKMNLNDKIRALKQAINELI